MTRLSFLPLILVLLAGSAGAEIERIATPADTGFKLQWWPKIRPPSGWHFDSGSSHRFGFNALAPDGSTFSEAETVIYAKANYKARMPKTKSLAQLVESDILDFHQHFPGMEVSFGPPVRTADKRQFKLVTFAPSSDGNWERVAYGENAEFFLLFTISSRSKGGLERAMPAFRATVASYRVGP